MNHKYFKCLTHSSSQSSHKGYALVILLVVLVIIGILTSTQMGGDSKSETEPQNIITNLDKSRATSCAANRSVLKQTMTMWSINNGGARPTIEKLEEARSVNVPKCPSGGKYIIGPEGREIYCTEHAPPPFAVEGTGDEASPPPGNPAP